MRRDLPSYLQWDESTETALRMKSTIPVYIHLDLLYSNFLLQRILVKRSLTESETLVSLAHQILQAMLAQIAIGRRCGNPFCELGWTVFLPLLFRPFMGHQSHADEDLDPLFWPPLSRDSRHRSPTPDAERPPVAEREMLLPLGGNSEPQQSRLAHPVHRPIAEGQLRDLPTSPQGHLLYFRLRARRAS